MKFTKPDETQLKRMTVRSLTALLDTLKAQRAELVKPYDLQIKFYEDLREKKRKQEEGQDAQTSSTV